MTTRPSAMWTAALASALAAVSFFTCVTAATAAPALERAIAVVLDPASLQRSGSIGAQQIVQAHVVLLAHDLPANDGVRALQFGLDLDPRLVLLETELTPLANVPVQPAPGEWAVGFSTCLEHDALPLSILRFSVMLAPGVVDADDLQIGVRGLAGSGEPPMFLHCRWTDWAEPLADFGGVVLNPTGPRVLGFASGRALVVEGRSYDLGWATTGADSVRVDGLAQAGDGVLAQIASTSRVHEIRAFSSTGSEHVATAAIEVVREPRVVSLHAHETDEFGMPRTQVQWEVQGAESVELIGVGVFPPRTTKLLAANDTGVWELVATNEWGSTTATTASIDLSTSPPVITRFDASPAEYLPGEEIQLRYLVFGADDVRIEPDIGAVPIGDASVTVRPEGAVTYSLIATNTNGTSSRLLAVVPAAPRITWFRTEPQAVDLGEPLEFDWRVEGADQVSIGPEVGDVDPVEGPLSFVPPRSAWYTLTARNAWGQSEARAAVEVRVPQIQFFLASPTMIFPGETTRISWVTYGQTRLEFGPPAREVFGPSGTLDVQSETDSTRFWLRLEAPSDTIVAWTNPVIWKKPALSVSITSWALDDTEHKIRVTATGADSLHIHPEIGSVDPRGGEFLLAIRDTTEVVVTGTNRAGATVVRRLIEPRFYSPHVDLTASKSWVYAGQSVSLVAVVARADSVRIDPGPGWIAREGGTFEVAVDDTTTYVLTAYGRRTTSQGTFPAIVRDEVTVKALLPRVRLTFNGTTVPPGMSVPLYVNASGAQSLTLEPGFGAVQSRYEPYWAVIDSATTFVLTGTNTLGASSDSVHIGLTPPMILAFTARDSSIVSGETTELSWSTVAADTVRIDSSEGASWVGLARTGKLEVSPATSTRYTLSARSDLGVATATAEIDVAAFAIREFRAEPNSVFVGEPVTLYWRVDGQAEVEIDGLGPQAATGSIELVIDASRQFTLRARDALQELSRTIDVSARTPLDPVVWWSWVPDAIAQWGHAPRPFEVFDAYLVFSPGPVQVENLGLRLVLPPSVVLVGIEDQEENGYLRVPQKQALDLVYTARWDCVFTPVPITLARVTFLVMDSLSAEDVLDFAGTASVPAPGGGPGLTDCNLVRRALARGLPLHIGGAVEVGALTATLHATRGPHGVQLQWETNTGACATAVRILRAEGGDGFDLAGHLVASGDCAPGSFTDERAPASTALRYRVEIQTSSGAVTSNEVRIEASSVAAVLRSRLLANIPNPFNPRTELRYELAIPGEVTIEIFDVAGRRVRTFALGDRPAGPGSVIWPGDDDQGAAVASGIYIVALRSVDGQDRRRVVLVR